MNYRGVIIEESLENKAVLAHVKIVSTKVEQVKESHQTPWIKQWTLHTVEIPEGEADAVANELARALDSQHDWYADFKNQDFHYIIYRNKVFKVGRKNKAQYDEAEQYGRSIGIPAHQLINYEGEYKDA